MSSGGSREPLASLEGLPDPLPIAPPERPAKRVTIRPPGSKSLTNRGLVLAALAAGDSTLTGAEIDADDGAAMLAAIKALGAQAQQQANGSLRIAGVAGKPAGGASVDARDSGTTARFIAAASALAAAPIEIDGSARLRERPMAPLFQALRRMGAEIVCVGREGFLPARICAQGGELKGGAVELPGDVSSQFVSALLMIGAHCERGVSLRLTTPPVSQPYVDMTVALLRRITTDVRDARPDAAWEVPAQPGVWFSMPIEPDASAAMVFAAAALLLPGVKVELPWLGRHSLQGDARFLDILQRMSASVKRKARKTVVRASGERIRAVDANLTSMPDQAMTLAVLACFADGPMTIRGLRTLRNKECDRLAALEAELPKLGAKVEVFAHEGVAGADEGLRIDPAALPDAASGRPVVFDTYSDHRMAMSLALAGLRREGVAIRDPGCVRKTYPAFWRDFARLGALPPNADVARSTPRKPILF